MILITIFCDYAHSCQLTAAIILYPNFNSQYFKFMKISTCLTVLLIGATISVKAQIPNNGFENWTSFTGYEDPTYWGSTNSYSSGPFYACTKSTDHYPLSVGSYSLRLENDPTQNPSFAGRGALFTGPPPPRPNFAISGHPTSLTGYYKFAPVNGDTMYIQVQLFYHGSGVGFAQLTTTVAAPNWTSFNIPISLYTTADSGSIIIAAYYANGFNYMPHGNSVLYVDNLNFDNLITGVNTVNNDKGNVSIYPNPAKNQITIDLKNVSGSLEKITIYNILGEAMSTQNHSGKVKSSLEAIDINGLSAGIYMVEVITDNGNFYQKISKQ